MRARTAIAIVLVAALAPACGRATPGARVRVSDAWARATSGAASAGAAYLCLESPAADALVGVNVAPAVARFAQVHETVREGAAGGASTLRMRHVKRVALPAGERVVFAPGQRHIMLLELARPLAAGDTIALALAFAHAPAETVRVPVRDE